MYMRPQNLLTIIAAGILAVLGLAACGSDSSNQESDLASTRSPAEIAAQLDRGIDVSYHSGNVDWDSVKAEGYTFAFIKATEGQDLKDPAFDQHWRELKLKGIPRGAYHFYVTEDHPDTMAAFFIENVKLDPGDFAPAVDIELIGHDTPPGLKERLQRFLEILEDHYGIKPIIYTTAKFWDEHLKADFSDYPLWVAEYDVDEPVLPHGWKEYHLWQFKGNVAVPGVEKGADVSRVGEGRFSLKSLITSM